MGKVISGGGKYFTEKFKLGKIEGQILAGDKKAGLGPQKSGEEKEFTKDKVASELKAVKFKDFAEQKNKEREAKDLVSKSISEKDKKKADRKTAKAERKSKRKSKKSARLQKKIELQEFKGKQKLASGDKVGAKNKIDRIANLKKRQAK